MSDERDLLLAICCSINFAYRLAAALLDARPAFRTPATATSCRTLPDNLCDSACSIFHVLVFPNMDCKPSPVSQGNVLPAIPLTGSQQLRAPPPAVMPRHRAVTWTVVPKTPIHKDSHLGGTKDDIGTAGQSRRVQPKTQALPMQKPTQIDLRGSIPRRHHLHSSTHDMVERQRTIVILLSRHDSVFHSLTCRQTWEGPTDIRQHIRIAR
jgi:hypothetical protein